jgi:hypothetical protein
MHMLCSWNTQWHRMLQYNSLNANFGFLLTGYHLLAVGLLVQSNTVLLLYFSLDCSIRCTGVGSEASWQLKLMK